MMHDYKKFFDWLEKNMIVEEYVIRMIKDMVEDSYIRGRIDALEESLVRRSHSEETKTKISESMKKSWDERKIGDKNERIK